MVLGSVKPDDIVLCDVRGDRFYARAVVINADGALQIESLTGRPIPAMWVGSRQVVGHWMKSKRSKQSRI